jgi:hypothetical protein
MGAICRTAGNCIDVGVGGQFTLNSKPDEP